MPSASPVSGTVDVTLTAGHDAHELTIADRGPGLDDVDKQQAMTRFWRGDQSSPGTGLGLAIARSIVEAAAGTLSLADNAPTGLIASVRIVADRDGGPKPTLV